MIKPGSRLFSLGAAVVLLLIMTTGASAGDAITTTITLVRANCSASLSDAQIDFGTWLYDSGSGTYRPTTEQHSEFTVTTSIGSLSNPESTCTVEVTASKLSNPENTGEGDGLPVVMYETSPFPGPRGEGRSVIPLIMGIDTTKTVEVEVEGLITLQNFDPLTYTGTITVTSTNASN